MVLNIESTIGIEGYTFLLKSTKIERNIRLHTIPLILRKIATTYQVAFKYFM